MHSQFDETRRRYIKTVLTASLGGVVASVAPHVWSKKRLRLRVLGTHVTLQEAIRQQAMQDLGIEVSFEPGGSATVLQKASTQPASFDLYEQWSDSINLLWSAKAIQPIDIQRLKYWGEINDLTKTGRLVADAKTGAGDAPYKLLYAQRNGELSSKTSEQISFLPYVHNVDSFGYNTAEIPKGIPYQTESWGWLFEQKYRGKVGIVNTPTIGLFDMALAAQA
ncbi:signal peptide prediction, partial [Catenovulum agarivorans DS-2]